ncbi:MAG TPA: DegT/DnrJ/EryC1/StrS family aminotransferase [Sedimentisphaerales bacterium]|nr:DegT/DnrJ/EryC1/StrS family aminotransferase [Sedimentisphaerales bacterium]
MHVPFLNLKAQYAGIKEQLLQAIGEVCDSQMLCLGPKVEEFEARIAEYCGSKCAVGVSSGTDALLVSLMALGIRPGDEVITTPFTFFATAGAIVRVGAKPVFVDVQDDSCNIDPAQIEEKITDKTRAIIPVDMFGQAADMEPIMEIAAGGGLSVIEDSCQSLGASRNGIKCGNLGTVGCFSFYPTKNLGGFGDGGMVITSEEKLAEKIRILRDHGQQPRYFYDLVGGNFRLDAIQAAVLIVKLKYLDEWNEKRRQNAAIYDRILGQAPVICPRVRAGNTSIYHQYAIRAAERDSLQTFLGENNVGSAVFYPQPLHLQACFRDLGYKKGDFPVAEKVCKEVLSLPIYPELSEKQIEYAADMVVKFYKSRGCVQAAAAKDRLAGRTV